MTRNSGEEANLGRNTGEERPGMLQAPQLEAEQAAIAANYQANLAKIREDEARGEIMTICQGEKVEDIMGHGPWGLSREERERRERERRRSY